MPADKTPEWLDCQDYALTMNSKTPLFRLIVTCANDREGTLRARVSDPDTSVFDRVVKWLASDWKNTNIQIQLDSDDTILDIREKPKGKS